MTDTTRAPRGLDEDTMRRLLEDVRRDRITIEDALQSLRRLPFDELDFAKLDNHRALRTGFPEVIFCPGKRLEHLITIMKRCADGPGPMLATRAEPHVWEAAREALPHARYEDVARMIVHDPEPLPKRDGTILVLTAGTSDIPVAEEAAITADVMGNSVERIYDVGVAGVHRLLAHFDLLSTASVIVCVAGMEAALPSVVGGLVRRPVIAVPTSVGYGASFGGLAALLGVLNTCSSGVTVVNIDNGYGAGFSASLINAVGQAR